MKILVIPMKSGENRRTVGYTVFNILVRFYAEVHYDISKFDEADLFSQGAAIVCVNNKYGFIDTKGNYIIEPKFDQADYLSYSSNKSCILSFSVYKFI